VNIPDANFKAALLAIPGIDDDGDFEVQIVDAAAFTGSMNLSGLGINDMTGIEAFTGVADIDCSLNNISSLDLSSCTSLQSLICSGNLLLNLNIQNGNNSNLTIFDATSNPSLICIQVDDPGFMDANFSGGKDAGASYSTSCTIVCNVNIPDANFKAVLLANAAINTNADGEIQCTEAAAFVGDLDAFGLNITDLTGIEALVNLHGFDCNKFK
jgi:hypothetical protein